MLSTRHASILSALFVATASCTSTVVVDTSELEQKIASLEARVGAIEGQNLATEVQELKARITNGPRLNEARLEQIVARKVEQAVRQGTSIPDAAVQSAAQPAARPNAGARPRRTLPGDAQVVVDRSMRRAEQIAKNIGLDEAQTKQLGHLLQTHQERMAAAMRSAKEAKTPKEEVRERIQVIRQANEAELAEFTATLAAEQRAKFEQAMGPRRAMIEKAQKRGGAGAPWGRGGMDRARKNKQDKGTKAKKADAETGDDAEGDEALQY